MCQSRSGILQGLNEVIVRIVHLGHLSLGVAEQRVTLVVFCAGAE